MQKSPKHVFLAMLKKENNRVGKLGRQLGGSVL